MQLLKMYKITCLVSINEFTENTNNTTVNLQSIQAQASRLYENSTNL